MRNRTRALFPALLLALLCLAGCGRGDDPPAAAYDGVWYAAANGVECRFVGGKIYKDDNSTRDGQALRGIYSDAGDHVEANLTGVGGVGTPRSLYIVKSDQGDMLCDSTDGSGTVYFYRDPMTVLKKLEAQEAERQSDLPAEPVRALPAADTESESADPGVVELVPIEGDDRSPLADSKALPEEQDEPAAEVDTKSGMVWIPQSGSKYHTTPSCSGMKNPSKVTLAEAKSRGYTPCKRCH